MVRLDESIWRTSGSKRRVRDIPTPRGIEPPSEGDPTTKNHFSAQANISFWNIGQVLNVPVAHLRWQLTNQGAIFHVGPFLSRLPLFPFLSQPTVIPSLPQLHFVVNWIPISTCTSSFFSSPSPRPFFLHVRTCLNERLYRFINIIFSPPGRRRTSILKVRLCI